MNNILKQSIELIVLVGTVASYYCLSSSQSNNFLINESSEESEEVQCKDNVTYDGDNLEENPNRTYNLAIKDYDYFQTYFEYFDRNNYQKRPNGTYNPSGCYIPSLSSTMVGSSFSNYSSTDYYNNYIPPYYSWGNLGSDTYTINSSITDMTLVTSTTSFPYCTMGHLIIKRYLYNYETLEFDTKYYVGSGFLVGPNTILTAGHCVFGDCTKSYESNGEIYTEYEDNIDNPVFVDELEFIPGRNGSIRLFPNDHFYAKRIYVHYDYFTSVNSYYDWAVVEFDTNIGYKTGWNGCISGHLSNQMNVTVYGYPGNGNSHQYYDGGIASSVNTNQSYVCSYDSYGGVSGGGVKCTFTNTYTYACGIHVSRSLINSEKYAKQINKFMVNLVASFLQSR